MEQLSFVFADASTYPPERPCLEEVSLNHALEVPTSIGACRPELIALEPPSVTRVVAEAGEELAYNRRNRLAELSWPELKAMAPALRTRSAIKAKIWAKPNYEALIAAGMHQMCARLLKHFYDSVGAKPTGPDDASIEAYVVALGRYRDCVLEMLEDRQAVFELLAMAVEVLRRDSQAIASDLKGYLEEGERKFIDVMLADVPSSMQLSHLRRKMHRFFLTRFWPAEFGSAPLAVSPRLGDATRSELRTLGGKRTYSRIQVDANDIAEMTKDLLTGWPSTRESWELQGYSITERLQGTETQHVLRDKRGREKGSFASRTEAVYAARAAVQKNRTEWGPDQIELADLRRVGPVRVSGNVSADQLLKTFALRGVNFGNWMPSAERQAHLNLAFPALMDLAEITGLAPADLGQRGLTGLAFGAQGCGKRGGHYVPGLEEINFTRFGGAGVPAHEFGHSLDHAMARLLGYGRGEQEYLSEIAIATKPSAGEHPLMRQMRRVMETLSVVQFAPHEAGAKCAAQVAKSRSNAESWLCDRNFRFPEEASEAAQSFRKLRSKLLATGLDRDGPKRQLGKTRGFENYVDVDLAEMYDLAVAALGGSRFVSREKFQGAMPNLYTLHSHLPGGQKFREMHSGTTKRASNYVEQSVLMDKDKGGKLYWSTRRELFARAFSDWVRVALAEKGYENEYLAIDLAERFRAAKALELVPAVPFLEGDELAAACSAMSLLVEELRVALPTHLDLMSQ